MICSKCVFVFEVKTFSGWIFGNEYQKDWYQTLPNGRNDCNKNTFYNPIMQNRSHIKHLKNYIGEHIPMWSLIVFSDNCVLKNIQIQSSDICITYNHIIKSVISNIFNYIQRDLLSEKDINELYNKLYPLTQVDEYTKLNHVLNIHNKLNPNNQRVIPLSSPPKKTELNNTQYREL